MLHPSRELKADIFVKIDGPIPYGDAPSGAMQTTKLQSAKKLTDIIG
jgi:hypothetical protein